LLSAKSADKTNAASVNCIIPIILADMCSYYFEVCHGALALRFGKKIRARELIAKAGKKNEARRGSLKAQAD
jgi:hypothetical protein